MTEPAPNALISRRFRGFLPVIVDVETGGLNPQTDALLEIAAVILLVADTCARTVISPIILPVGAITSLLGAPMFFYMLLNLSARFSRRILRLGIVGEAK